MADNGTDVATLYSGAVHGSPVSQVPLIVSIPGGAPTGQVFNPTNGFKLRVGDMRLPARFIFDSEAGTITAWTPTDPLQTTARTKLTVPGAVFKGLALSFFDHHPALYATDFTHNHVVVVDSHFHRVATPGMFVSRGHLNAPWGLVRAPAGFGRFGGALLVGNFGDGRINAYDFSSGEFLGSLHRPDGRPVAIEGLWGLMFGNGVTASPNELLFSAGIDDESHGLLGKIRHVS